MATSRAPRGRIPPVAVRPQRAKGRVSSATGARSARSAAPTPVPIAPYTSARYSADEPTVHADQSRNASDANAVARQATRSSRWLALAASTATARCRIARAPASRANVVTVRHGRIIAAGAKTAACSTDKPASVQRGPRSGSAVMDLRRGGGCQRPEGRSAPEGRGCASGRDLVASRETSRSAQARACAQEPPSELRPTLDQSGLLRATRIDSMPRAAQSTASVRDASPTSQRSRAAPPAASSMALAVSTSRSVAPVGPRMGPCQADTMRPRMMRPCSASAGSGPREVSRYQAPGPRSSMVSQTASTKTAAMSWISVPVHHPVGSVVRFRPL